MEKSSLILRLSELEEIKRIIINSDEYLKGGLLSRVENMILCTTITLKSGIEIPEYIPLLSRYYEFSEFIHLVEMGESINRTIGCPDDGIQPEQGWYLKISFPSGPYIFGDYFDNFYPKELFDKFFQELKSYHPQHVDTINNALYYKIEEGNTNVGKVYHNFNDIYNKYVGMINDERKKLKIIQLEAELNKLKKD